MESPAGVSATEQRAGFVAAALVAAQKATLSSQLPPVPPGNLAGEGMLGSFVPSIEACIWRALAVEPQQKVCVRGHCRSSSGVHRASGEWRAPNHLQAQKDDGDQGTLGWDCWLHE